jgi:hypothetical protein
MEKHFIIKIKKKAQKLPWIKAEFVRFDLKLPGNFCTVSFSRGLNRKTREL